MKKSIFLTLFFGIVASSFCQVVKNENLVYDNNIHSVILNKVGHPEDQPFIRLGSSERLRLAFDDMSDESYFFSYTLVLCDSDWKTSRLDPNEYLDGSLEEEIDNHVFSLNAIPGYIHYEATVPSREMRPKLSGNYILKVYLNYPTDENVIFTMRFYVVEPLAQIDISIPYYPKNLEFTRSKQQIDLGIITPDLFNYEPMRRISVNIQQNGRWDNMKTGLKPTTITSNLLIFNYPNGIVFDGGNEYRNFNMESFNYQSMYIRRIINEANGYTVQLHTSYSRKNKPYETLEDINGRRIIMARKDQTTVSEGEYAWVYFTLKSPRIENTNLYILGELNNWQLNEKSKMEYNSSSHQYEGALYLKQGYYDYLYAAVPDGKTEGDVTIIEGDHWETGNDYTIYMYYRETVPEYDRIVGFATVNSREVEH